MVSLERIDLEEITSKRAGKNIKIDIFHTPQWIDFLSTILKAEPIAAAVKSNGHTLGYFTGLVVRKYGIKILGSPFRGWTTDFMGLSSLPITFRREAMHSLLKFAFEKVGCHYIEIIDANICEDDCKGLSYNIEKIKRFIIDLTVTEDTLFSNMKHSCRNSIRKSIKSGVVIEKAHDIDFVKDYYSQLEDVFQKQSLTPPYSKERVKALIEKFMASDNLLLLRARNKDGKCIATGIFLSLNNNAIFWGAASWRKYQHLRPNEHLAWQGMKYCKSKGIANFHFGGGNPQYKKKFGSKEIELIRLKKGKYAFIEILQKLASYPMGSEWYKNFALRKILNQENT
jgi:hypothetical protein